MKHGFSDITGNTGGGFGGIFTGKNSENQTTDSQKNHDGTISHNGGKVFLLNSFINKRCDGVWD